jgi:transposase
VKEIMYMGKQYSSEFKLEAVRRYEASCKSIVSVAEELGVEPTTMQRCVSKYRKSPETPFPGSRNLSPEDEKVRKLEKEL